MSEDPSEQPDSDEEEYDDQPASTPFDNPFFLPVLLWGAVGWFAYDIVTNDPSYQKYPAFNQWGLLIGTIVALYFTWSAIKERRAEREKSPD